MQTDTVAEESELSEATCNYRSDTQSHFQAILEEEKNSLLSICNGFGARLRRHSTLFSLLPNLDESLISNPHPGPACQVLLENTTSYQHVLLSSVESRFKVVRHQMYMTAIQCNRSAHRIYSTRLQYQLYQCIDVLAMCGQFMQYIFHTIL